MACQCGVVCLDVELEVLIESVLAEEAYRSGCIEIILVFHRLFRFGLDIEITGKAYAAAVIDSHMHELRDILLLELHIGIEQRLIALTTAPEDIAAPAEFDGQIQGLFGLCCRKSEDISRIGGACAVHKARI